MVEIIFESNEVSSSSDEISAIINDWEENDQLMNDLE